MKHYRPFRCIRNVRVIALLLEIRRPALRAATAIQLLIATAIIVGGVNLNVALAQPSATSLMEIKQKAQEAFYRKDYATALALGRKAADQGDANAQTFVGLLYFKGIGIPQDYTEAMNWYRKAADQGHVGAENKVGFMYKNGLGVRKDDVQAVVWWRKAADQGDIAAQNVVGYMYVLGEGVPKDYARGMYWFRKAADQGDPEGQMHVGRMYRDGLGVHRDYFEAIAWYRKAAKQGYEDAKSELAAAEDHLHTNIPAALQFRCTLEGAPPMSAKAEEKQATERYDDCLRKNFKRLGVELQ